MLSITFPYSTDNGRQSLDARISEKGSLKLLKGYPTNDINSKPLYICIENIVVPNYYETNVKDSTVTVRIRYLTSKAGHVPVKISCYSNGNVIYIYENVDVELDAYSLANGKFKLSIFKPFSIKHSIFNSEHFIVDKEMHITTDTTKNVKYVDDILRAYKRSYSDFNPCTLRNEIMPTLSYVKNRWFLNGIPELVVHDN